MKGSFTIETDVIKDKNGYLVHGTNAQKFILKVDCSCLSLLRLEKLNFNDDKFNLLLKYAPACYFKAKLMNFHTLISAKAFF